YPKFTEMPYTYFSDEQTLLQGIKNKETGEVMIKAQYASIEEYYNNPLRVHQYPLLVAFSGDFNKYIYVGLNGTEYVLYSAEIE
ncbi:MAG: hypothetical protein ACN6ON_17685, partial [Sphingobacterium sp.]